MRRSDCGMYLLEKLLTGRIFVKWLQLSATPLMARVLSSVHIKGAVTCTILMNVVKMARSALDEMSDTGAFARSPSTFRNSISRNPDSHFLPEAGRYHLYVSYACPWASRYLAYLRIKGLDKAISFS